MIHEEVELGDIVKVGLRYTMDLGMVPDHLTGKTFRVVEICKRDIGLCPPHWTDVDESDAEHWIVARRLELVARQVTVE